MSQHFDVPRLKAIPLTSVAQAMGARLQRSGRRYSTLCPWHPDTHPSLVIYDDGRENLCHCFACGVTKDTIAYVMQMRGLSFADACQWLSAQFGIPSPDGQAIRPIQIPAASAPKAAASSEPTEKPQAYVPDAYVRSTLSTANSFSRCLAQLFGEEVAHHLTEEYRLGCYTSREGWLDTIFWTIDEQGRTHNGKVQRYCTDIRSPRFAHCLPLFGKGNRSFWLTNVLVKQGVVDNEARLDTNGLFGAHLLSRRPEDVVVLVESPKNALLGAARFPEFVWVAAGNMNALKTENIRSLRGREVRVYPDRDAINEWKIRILQFSSFARFQVSDFCERVATEGQAKYDIGDFIIDEQLRKLRADENS